MRFIIAKPSNKMSFGELFFNRPDCSETGIRLKAFEELCKRRLNEEFGSNPVMAERLEEELDMVAQTGSVLTLEIAAEIALLSKENGYPVCLFGEESGLLVMFLLGISGIHPKQYDFSETPSKLALQEVLKYGYLSVNLAIAEPIRELICPRLNQKFGHIGNLNGDYLNIFLPGWDELEKIGRLSQATNIPYSEIKLNDSALLSAVQKEIISNDFEDKNSEGIPPGNAVDTARYYAFARCNTKGEKDHPLFKDVRSRIFRDTVYEELLQLGIKESVAYDLSKLHVRSPLRQQEITMLERLNAPLNLIFIFKNLENLWSLAPCLSRINVFAMRKYYELAFPDEFEELPD